MKKVLLWILLLFSSMAHAQIVYWAVHPEYDRVEALDNGLYLVEKEGKVGLLGVNDQVILPIRYDSIAPFREDVALLINKEGILQGYTDMKGNIVSLEKEKYVIDNQYPYFSDNHLLVKKGKSYYYIHKNEDGAIGPFVIANPFFEGYASVKPYKNIIKGEIEETYLLLHKEGNRQFYDFGNDYKAGDINFVSSVSNNKVLISWKKKYYIYNLENRTMEDLYILDKKNKKQAVAANDDMIVPMTPDEDTRLLSAKNAVFALDRYYRLASIQYKGTEEPVMHEIKQEQMPKYDNVLSLTEDDGKIGISYQNEELLPAQFEEARLVKNDEVIVKCEGKYGIVRLDKNNTFNFDFILEAGKTAIDFTHSAFNTKVVMRMPSYIGCNQTTFESLSSGLTLQEYDRSDRENPAQGNSITYGCTLGIPEFISDKPSEFPYSFAVKYDKLKSKDYTIHVREWFANNYNVEPVNMEDEKVFYSVKDSTITGEIRIKNDKISGNMPINIWVRESEMENPIEAEKISEGYYRFTLSGIGRREVPYYVILQEDGCPFFEYNFSVSTEAKRTDTPKPQRAVSSGQQIKNPFNIGK